MSHCRNITRVRETKAQTRKLVFDLKQQTKLFIYFFFFLIYGRRAVRVRTKTNRPFLLGPFSKTVTDVLRGFTPTQTRIRFVSPSRQRPGRIPHGRAHTAVDVRVVGGSVWMRTRRCTLRVIHGRTCTTDGFFDRHSVFPMPICVVVAVRVTTVAAVLVPGGGGGGLHSRNVSESARSDIENDNGIYCNLSLTIDPGSFFVPFPLPGFPKIARLPIVSVRRPHTTAVWSARIVDRHLGRASLSFSRTCRNQLLHYPTVENRPDLFNCTNSEGISPAH